MDVFRPATSRRTFAGGRRRLAPLVVPLLVLVNLPIAAEPSPSALPVMTTVARLSATFESRRAFVGTVEAARRSELGFELGGRLEHVEVDEGEAVGADQVLARLDTARLDARRNELRAALEQVRAELKLAAATLARTEEARGFNGVSEQELDEARERFRALEAAERLAGSRVEAVEVDLAKSELRAPFAAIVTRRYVDEGQVVAAAQPVLRLQEDGALEVRVGIAGAAAEDLAPGDIRELGFAGRTLRGVVRAVLPVRGTGTRTVDVILTLEQDTEGLKPGDLVRLELAVAEERDGFWLPTGALTEGVRGLWSVLVAEPLEATDAATGATHRVVPRTVEVIHQQSERVYVQGTLSDGDLVVAEGNHRVVAGQGVRLGGGSGAQAQ